MEATILVVEDEEMVAELLREYLQANGFRCHVINTGLDVITWVRSNSPALILLDIMLPGKDGISLCKEIRAFSMVPIIMTTARIDEIDRLLGLELGADDYVCKPFSPREVVARVKAVLRRSGRTGNGGDEIELDKEGFRVLFDGKDVKLTAVEFNLFSKLYSQPGRIFSRDQLIEAIYSDRRNVNDRTVDSHIKKLRLKIAKIKPGIDVIYSVYGLGYKFEL